MSIVTRLDYDQYDLLVASGALDDGRRVELIYGEILEMVPIGLPHEDALDYLTKWSFQNLLLDRVGVRVQESVGLPELNSVPQPDLAWVVARRYRTRRPLPEDVLLIVEVSDSSLRYDRGEKAGLYAKAGIQDYWVVNLPQQCVEVFRDPQRGRYRTPRSFASGELVQPLAFPDLNLSVTMLFSDQV